MDSSAHERAGGARRLWLATCGLAAVLVLAMAFALWHLRRDALHGQARELGLVSAALTDEVDRGLQGVQEGLDAMQAELQDGQLAVSGADKALRTRAGLMPLVRTLWLVDRNGRVLSASDPLPAPPPASFLPALDKLGGNAVAVSRPIADTQTQDSMVTLAVGFSDATGTPAGWILAALPAKTLLGAFSVASPAADARMAVFRHDGALLAISATAIPASAGDSLADRHAGHRSVAVRGLPDGGEQLVGSYRLSHFGLQVILTRDTGVVLSAWKETVQLALAGLAILLLVMAAAARLVQLADQRHARARRALQAQISRAGKLESLGTLAGGVAHDFNNVLAAFVGFVEMAQDAAPGGSDQARQLDRALQAALRGKKLVERILVFSKGGARSSMVFELEPIVEEVLTLLTASLRPGVVLERGLEVPGARLRGDPTQAFEATLNLCTNAMQAMPEGGMLSVRLVRQHVARQRVLSHSRLGAGDYLALTVSDQGRGITPDVMEHLFEPFFTTRGAQSGTGLGLAVVHGVVAEFGGAIDVQSTPGHGARFTAYFPECRDAPDAPGAPPHPVPMGRGQTLLVVDDEAGLMALTTEMLKGLGYDAIGFSEPRAALRAVRDDPRRFAAVITDEVMPELSGTQLTEALALHAPHIPVLLVSGHGGAMLAARAAAAGVTRVLAKPLQRADLARALAELLR